MGMYSAWHTNWDMVVGVMLVGSIVCWAKAAKLGCELKNSVLCPTAHRQSMMKGDNLRGLLVWQSQGLGCAVFDFEASYALHGKVWPYAVHRGPYVRNAMLTHSKTLPAFRPIAMSSGRVGAKPWSFGWGGKVYSAKFFNAAVEIGQLARIQVARLSVLAQLIAGSAHKEAHHWGASTLVLESAVASGLPTTLHVQ